MGKWKRSVSCSGSWTHSLFPTSVEVSVLAKVWETCAAICFRKVKMGTLDRSTIWKHKHIPTDVENAKLSKFLPNLTLPRLLPVEFLCS